MILVGANCIDNSGFKVLVKSSKRAEMKNKLFDEIFENSLNDYPRDYPTPDVQVDAGENYY